MYDKCLGDRSFFCETCHYKHTYILHSQTRKVWSKRLFKKFFFEFLRIHFIVVDPLAGRSRLLLSNKEADHHAKSLCHAGRRKDRVWTFTHPDLVATTRLHMHKHSQITASLCFRLLWVLFVYVVVLSLPTLFVSFLPVPITEPLALYSFQRLSSVPALAHHTYFPS